MTIIKECQKCANYGLFGACRVEQTTNGDSVCNFIPKNGSATIVITNETKKMEQEINVE